MIDKDKVMSNPLFWELVKLRQKQKQDQAANSTDKE